MGMETKDILELDTAKALHHLELRWADLIDVVDDLLYTNSPEDILQLKVLLLRFEKDINDLAYEYKTRQHSSMAE